MFKEKTIKCFEFDDVNYVVEVVETIENDFTDVDFWLQKKGYGVKSLMFGFTKKALFMMCDEHTTYEDMLLELIRANILNQIRLYENDYAD